MRFLIDNQLPSALAHWLRERGHDAEHLRAAAASHPSGPGLGTRACMR
ncbi:MAG TPA: DUF5615 family PIN-like protein [Verrucomicrobiota bacterium]|nr:DUF5615 family PIN-like protein [Verrucomicrobiota bacterium]